MIRCECHYLALSRRPLSRDSSNTAKGKIQKVVDIRKLHNAQNSNQSNLLLSPFATPSRTGKSDHRKLHNSVCAPKPVNHNQTVVYHMMLSHVLPYS